MFAVPLRLTDRTGYHCAVTDVDLLPPAADFQDFRIEEVLDRPRQLRFISDRLELSVVQIGNQERPETSTVQQALLLGLLWIQAATHGKKTDGHGGQFLGFCRKNAYDTAHVEILTALIYLNMSPLHAAPFDEFLLYFGQWKLARALAAA